jgi:hypothetical protein
MTFRPSWTWLMIRRMKYIRARGFRRARRCSIVSAQKSFASAASEISFTANISRMSTLERSAGNSISLDLKYLIRLRAIRTSSLDLGHPQDHVAVALARPAQSLVPIEDVRLTPYLALALGVSLTLDASGAERMEAWRQSPRRRR